MQKAKHLIKLNRKGSLDDRARQYSNDALNVANALQNRVFKATLTHDVILSTPEATFETREKKKPRTRWGTCLLGFGFSAFMYASSFLYGQNQELKIDLQETRATVSILEDEIADYTSTISKRNRQIDLMEVKERNLDSEIEGLNLLLGDYEVEFDNRGIIIADLNTQVESLATKVTDYESKLNQNRKTFNGLKQERTQLYSQLFDARVREIKRNIEIMGFRREIRGLDSKVEGYEVQVASLNENITDLEQEIKGLNERIGGYETQLQQKNNTIEGLNYTIEGLEGDIQEHIRNLNLKNTQIQTLARNSEELQRTQQSYLSFIDHVARENLREEGEFRVKARFDIFSDQYARRLFAQGDSIFRGLVNQELRKDIAPPQGLTQEQAYRLWNSRSNDLRYRIGKGGRENAN